MRVIVTRPATQAAGWLESLRARGLDAVALPLIGIAPAQDLAPVQQAWKELAQASLVMFVSANAVEQFFAAKPEGSAWPADLPAASTGPGTTAALRAAGVVRVEEPAADSPQFDSESLWTRIASWPWAGSTVVVVRGEDGRDWLGQQLNAAGAQVRYVSAYRRLAPVLDAAGRALLAQALVEPAAHRWLFSSSEAVGNLKRLAPGAHWASSWALASHPRIAQAALDAGFGHADLVGPGAEAVLRHLGLT